MTPRCNVAFLSTSPPSYRCTTVNPFLLCHSYYNATMLIIYHSTNIPNILYFMIILLLLLYLVNVGKSQNRFLVFKWGKKRWGVIMSLTSLLFTFMILHLHLIYMSIYFSCGKLHWVGEGFRISFSFSFSSFFSEQYILGRPAGKTRRS